MKCWLYVINVRVLRLSVLSYMFCVLHIFEWPHHHSLGLMVFWETVKAKTFCSFSQLYFLRLLDTIWRTWNKCQWQEKFYFKYVQNTWDIHSMLSLKEFTCTSLTLDLLYFFLKTVLLKILLWSLLMILGVKCQLSGKQHNVSVFISYYYYYY